MRQSNCLPIIALFALGSTPIAASAQRAGELISAAPVVDTPGGMQAWRIRYWTRSERGRAVQATGMVIAPREAMPARPRDVLAWTHGTWGVASRCAPSLSANFWTATPALQAVSRGYTVVAADYPGLGGPGVHPFLAGVDTGRSVIDAVRAARGIAGAAAGNRYAVWGESQGGHAALWTGQVARGYAPELTLVGVAAAAPPTDLVENLRQTPNQQLKAFFTALIGYSWSQNYGAPLATLGGPQTRMIMTRLAQNNCIELGAKPKLGMIAGIVTLQSRLKNTDLGTIQPWARLARANSVATRRYDVPLLIAQNPRDDLVAPGVTKTFARAQCRAGARIDYIAIAGEGHASSAKDSASETLAWIGDRFAGRRAPSDCGRI